MTLVSIATVDPSLRATVRARHPLLYTSHADAALQRPDHVRAASGLAWLNGRLIAIQDDASFVAVIDVGSGAVDAIALPANPRGERVFDTERGNKSRKLDLEACTPAVRDDVSGVLALGSGSSPAREQLVWLSGDGDPEHAQLIHTPRLYAALRANSRFCTSELNIEGAVLVGDRLRLFQRSNGTPHAHARHCASCDLSWPMVCALLAAPGTAPIPPIENVRQYDLGTIDRVRLTFTDASLRDAERVIFVASAEGSPNAIDDGTVVGTALGVIDAEGHARLCALLDEHGTPITDKAEGIALFLGDPDRAWLVFDPDDHRRPATLAEVELRGF